MKNAIAKVTLVLIAIGSIQCAYIASDVLSVIHEPIGFEPNRVERSPSNQYANRYVRAEPMPFDFGLSTQTPENSSLTIDQQHLYVMLKVNNKTTQYLPLDTQLLSNLIKFITQMVKSKSAKPVTKTAKHRSFRAKSGRSRAENDQVSAKKNSHNQERDSKAVTSAEESEEPEADEEDDEEEDSEEDNGSASVRLFHPLLLLMPLLFSLF
jgi:hypothetical protein